jgi:hypothetical protein
MEYSYIATDCTTVYFAVLLDYNVYEVGLHVKL